MRARWPPALSPLMKNFSSPSSPSFSSDEKRNLRNSATSPIFSLVPTPFPPTRYSTDAPDIVPAVNEDEEDPFPLFGRSVEQIEDFRLPLSVRFVEKRRIFVPRRRVSDAPVVDAVNVFVEEIQSGKRDLHIVTPTDDLTKRLLTSRRQLYTESIPRYSSSVSPLSRRGIESHVPTNLTCHGS